MKNVCDVCGNESASLALLCPFCGSKLELAQSAKRGSFVHKTVNLEAGRPIVEVALGRLDEILKDSARNKVNVLTLIHGYGSSGKGGAIRSECRKSLDFLKSKGEISDYIAGEDFYKRFGKVKSLIRRYPQLGSDKNLNRGNRGVTLVILSHGLLLLAMHVLSTIFNATYWS